MQKIILPSCKILSTADGRILLECELGEISSPDVEAPTPVVSAPFEGGPQSELAQGAKAEVEAVATKPKLS